MFARAFCVDDHSVVTEERQKRIREAFAALDSGDAGPFEDLLAPEAEWVAIPQGEISETAACPNRAAIVERLERVHRRGRRFQVGKMIEARDRVAVEVTLLSPEWSAPVTLYRVFAFGGDDVVVRLNDCVDESYALQVLVS